MKNQSNNQIIISDTFEFQRLIDILNSSLDRINDLFEKEKLEMENINATDIWTGEVQKRTYDKYQQLSKSYDSVSESLGIYIKFLQNTVDQYINAEETIDRNIETNSDNIDVNS